MSNETFKFLVYTIVLYIFNFIEVLGIHDGKIPNADFEYNTLIILVFIVIVFMAFKLGITLFEGSNNAKMPSMKIAKFAFYIIIYFLIGLFLLFLVPEINAFGGCLYLYAFIGDLDNANRGVILECVLILSNFALILAGFLYKLRVSRRQKSKTL